MAACLYAGVNGVFSNHLYSLGGLIYHQNDGGPIGLRITACCARLRMAMWAAKLLQILNKLEIKVHMLVFYVDDVRLGMQAIKPGWRWESSSQQLKFSKEWEAEEEHLDPTVKTMMVLKDIMNSLERDMTFTAESHLDFEDLRLPTLDVNLWIQKPTQVGSTPFRYTFFRKPMASRFLILEKSAMSWEAKKASLSQEVVRRMSNIQEEVQDKERIRVLEEFINLMKFSGYRLDQRREIMVAGLTGYLNKVARAKKLGSEFHRSAGDTRIDRRRVKLATKNTWFCKDRKDKLEFLREQGTKSNTRTGVKPTPGDSRKPVTVIFVPRTPAGALTTLLREKETQLAGILSKKVKIVEEKGDTLKFQVWSPNPWRGEDCRRPDCMICLGKEQGEKGGGDCRSRGVLYENTCQPCKVRGVEAKYVGESGRSGGERSAEHVGDARRDDPKSHMLQHLRAEHPELIGGETSTHKHFRMKILRQHNKPLGRLLHEALKIGNEIARGKKILNNLEEYSRCFIPTLDTIRNPLNPNSKPARTQRVQESGEKDGTPVAVADDPSNPTETNTVPGTELDLDEYDEILKMKRKMIDELDENECEHAGDRNTHTYTQIRKKMRYTEKQPCKDPSLYEETNTQTDTQSSSPRPSPESTGITSLSAQARKVTHIEKDTHTHRGTTHTSKKHTKGAIKHDTSSLPKNPLRSNNSRNLKTSRRGTKDVYLGESITNYFPFLRSGGADRYQLKGKPGTSLGSQVKVGDEVNGTDQVDGQEETPRQLKLKQSSSNTNQN